jgi:hypothetical protein
MEGRFISMISCVSICQSGIVDIKAVDPRDSTREIPMSFESIDGSMDRWIDGSMDRWIDGSIDRRRFCDGDDNDDVPMNRVEAARYFKLPADQALYIWPRGPSCSTVVTN